MSSPLLRHVVVGVLFTCMRYLAAWLLHAYLKRNSDKDSKYWHSLLKRNRMVSFVTMGAQLHNTLLPTRTWHCYSVIKNHRSRIFCLYTFSKRKGSLSWLSHGRGGGGGEKLVTKWGKSLSSLIKSACSVCHWLKNPPKMLNVRVLKRVVKIKYWNQTALKLKEISENECVSCAFCLP